MSIPAVLLLPATAAFMALGRPMAATLFPGLRYDPAQGIDEPGNVALVLAIMAIGLLPFGITALKQRYCFARGDGWTNFWLVALMTSISLAAAALAAWVVQPEYVVATVAAGSSLASIIAAGAFLLVARRQLGGLDLGSVKRLWARLTLASAVAGLAAWGAASLVADPASPWLRQGVALAVGGLVLAAVFFALARLMRVREVDEMLAPILRRLHLAR